MENVLSKYEGYSIARKKGQEDGTVPAWMSTAGYQMFVQKYMHEAENPKQQFRRIARAAAQYAPLSVCLPDGSSLPLGKEEAQKYWERRFFEIMWNGWMACSTPVLANMGTNRGCSVSCAGSVIHDSIYGFYSNYLEVATLTKQGFGTASDFSAIRPRGSAISVGGKASGVLPVIKHHVQDMRDVAQGTARRGAFAAYLDIEHGDFWEVLAHLKKTHDDLNIGWIVRDSFIHKMEAGDVEANNRFKNSLAVKMVTGKGYFFFVDKANRHRPQMYKDKDLDIKASQLCSEIMLHSDAEKYTYTCVLAWMNLSKSDEWENTDAAFVATVFLDCVVSDFINTAEKIPGMQKAVAATKAGRAVGLGAGGFHTYLQTHDIPFEHLDAQYYNARIFQHIDKQSLRASRWLAKELGEPEWCKGYGVRFTHRMAIAPTKSTSLIYGGVSEGINPDIAMCFTQLTSAGEVSRVNPPLLALIKRKGLNIEQCIKEVAEGYGSAQHVSWLTKGEKEVFRNAFETDPQVILRYAAQRQRYVDQGQSLNLFFPGNADGKEIARIHRQAFLDPNILSLYYLYSSRNVVSSRSECSSCQ